MSIWIEEINVKRIRDHDLPLPSYETKGSAGFDFRADLSERDSDVLNIVANRDSSFRSVYKVPTGFAFEVPRGFEMQIRPRSSLAQSGLQIVNSPGTVDSDYRGEVKILVGVVPGEKFVVEHGQRIAQGVISPVTRAYFNEVDTLKDTDRGDGGFGSTGEF